MEFQDLYFFLFFYFWALFISSNSEFVEKRDKTVFKIREFIDFITSIFMTGIEEMREYHFWTPS